jgi:hypothetical protein
MGKVLVMKMSAYLAIVSLLISGCSGAEGEVPVYKVSGTVSIGGGPVPRATVIFSPQDKTPVATAITDNKGVYRLTTYDSYDGAAAGKYDVLISKATVPKGSSAPVHDPTGQTNPAPVHSAGKSKDLDDGITLDPKFSLPGNGMTAEVSKSGPNVFDFKL